MGSKIEVKRKCKRCRCEFIARKTDTKYCSHDCSKKVYKERGRQEKIAGSNEETAYLALEQKEEAFGKAVLDVNEIAEILGISRKMVYLNR